MFCIGFLSNTFAHYCMGSHDHEGILDVNLMTYNGLQDTDIYANGNMQAALDVAYQLSPGFTIKTITLKSLQSGEPLEGWTQSENENEYLHSIDDWPYSQPKFEGKSKRVYLATKKNQNIAVCVELTAEKAGLDVFKSTCSSLNPNGIVTIRALAPFYLSKADFDLTDWSHSSVIDKYISPRTGTWSNEIREQVLRSKAYIPKIKRIESQFMLEGKVSPLFLKNALISQYTPNVNFKGVSHIMSWFVNPKTVTNIEFIENVGLNESWGSTVRRAIPYEFQDDPNYIGSLVTYILRDDKFLYDGYQHYALCEESFMLTVPPSDVRKCQVRGPLNIEAPWYIYFNEQIENWKIERLKGTINVIDEYGTSSPLNIGIKYLNDVYSEIILE